MNLGFESEEVEFKASTAQTSRALEALAAMLNKHGKGRVCFGVSDNGEVVGQLIIPETKQPKNDSSRPPEVKRVRTTFAVPLRLCFSFVFIV